MKSQLLVPNYQTQILNGEKQGLIVELYGSHFCVIIKFGMIQAMRMLDEGIVQDNLYSKNEIKRYKDNNFRNVIYEIKEGEFGKQINAISNGYAECLRLKHYIVITQNRFPQIGYPYKVAVWRGGINIPSIFYIPGSLTYICNCCCQSKKPQYLTEYILR